LLESPVGLCQDYISTPDSHGTFNNRCTFVSSATGPLPRALFCACRAGRIAAGRMCRPPQHRL